jgi:hypothetical protein
MADEAVELLINLKNHKSAERGLDAETVARRENAMAEEQVRAESEAQRAGALARLRERAAEDQVMADLLLVLGL